MTEEMESPSAEIEDDDTQGADADLGDGAPGNRTPIYTKIDG